MGNRSKARFANGVVSAFIVVFFLAHGLLGCAALLFGFLSPFTWIVWIGLGVVVLHVVLSVVTSREQLTDEQHPPSARKKRHLALKWATGIALAAGIGLHVFLKGALVARVAIVVVAVLLGVHLWVGSKSLLADLNIDRRFQIAVRVIACVFAMVFVVAAIVSGL